MTAYGERGQRPLRQVRVAQCTIMVYWPRVEKRKPAYDLEAFKAVCGNVQTLPVTGVALRGAATLGFGREDS
jgi:hypothetical protein